MTGTILIVDRLLIVVVIVVILGCGAGRIILRLVRHGDKEILAHNYLEKLKDYVESHGEDSQAYGWLTHQSNQMQNQLGAGGILAAYKPPFANYQYSSYPIILNMLPDLRKAFDDDLLSRRLAHQFATTIQEVLIRHAGSLESQRSYLEGQLKNPIVWLREGVRMVLALPLSLLSWTGVVSQRASRRITSSQIFRIASGLATLVGLISAIIGIAVGWDEFVKLLGFWWIAIR